MSIFVCRNTEVFKLMLQCFVLLYTTFAVALAARYVQWTLYISWQQTYLCVFYASNSVSSWDALTTHITSINHVRCHSQTTAHLNVSEALFTIGVKTSCTRVTSTVNVPLDCDEVNRFFDQHVILGTAGYSHRRNTAITLNNIHIYGSSTELGKHAKETGVYLQVITAIGRIQNSKNDDTAFMQHRTNVHVLPRWYHHSSFCCFQCDMLLS